MLGIRPTGLPLPEETGKPQNMEDRWLHRTPQQGPVTSSIQGPSQFLSSCLGGAPRGLRSSLGFWVPPRFRAQGLHRQALGAGVQQKGCFRGRTAGRNREHGVLSWVPETSLCSGFPARTVHIHNTLSRGCSKAGKGQGAAGTVTSLLDTVFGHSLTLLAALRNFWRPSFCEMKTHH